MSEFGMRPAIEYMKEYFKNVPIKGAELGVFKGINAERFLNMLNIEKLHLIDTWITPSCEKRYSYETFAKDVFGKFKENEKIIIYRENTSEAVKKIQDDSLDFIYIDADHSYSGCKEDMELWYPKLKTGGVFVGHDYFCIEGVKKAVDEFIYSNKLKLVAFDAIGIYDKVKYGEWLIIKP